MKSVALINNTMNQMHHGCEVVVHQIETMLRDRGVSVVVSVMEGQHWRDAPEFMKSLPHLDGIIVNGEGTIHHNRRAGRHLVEVSQLAKSSGLPCFLINTTYQENSEEYRSYLEAFDRIYVRESESFRELERIGIESRVIPDMTLSYHFRAPPESFREQRSGIGVTDSSMVSTAEALYSLSVREGFSFLPVLRSYKNNWKFRWLELMRRAKFSLMLVLRQVIPSDSYLQVRNRYVKHSVNDYLEALSRCEGIVSGRFHSDCFCLLTETPFLAIDGNSHKVSSMIRDVGLSPERIIVQNEIESVTKESVVSFSPSEKKAIKRYIDGADVLINECFDELVGILEGRSVLNSAVTEAQVQVE